jgi:SAM-dependent methyltransferase
LQRGADRVRTLLSRVVRSVRRPLSGALSPATLVTCDSLEIGGGRNPQPGWTNLDPVHGEGTFRRRIQDGIPLPDASLQQARASHLMEHIAAGAERVFAMNEVWRVLVPGGTFEVVVPLFGGWGALADPTHLSFWVRESFDYFTGATLPDADYGIRYWDLVEWTTRDCDWGTEGRAVLSKPSELSPQ